MTVEDEGFEPSFEDVNEKPKKKQKQLKNEEAKTAPVKTSQKKLKKERAEDEQNNVEKTSSKKKLKNGKKEESNNAEDVSIKEKLEESKKKKKKGKTGKQEVAKEEISLDETENKKTKNPTKKRKAEENGNSKPVKKAKQEQVKSEVKLDSNCQDVLKRLKDIKMVYQVRELLGKEVSSGKIDEATSQTIFKQWRKANKTSDLDKRATKIIQMEGTEQEVQSVINQLLEKRLLRPYQAKNILNKWRNRERRRVGRQEEKKQKKFCFQCRQNGHLLTECPQKDSANATNDTGICFKCGSGEHSVHKCPKNHVKGYPFATCFVCKEQGHLSKDCEKNPNGIYPDGGSCSVCGSQMHLKRDCPELVAQKKKTTEKNKKVTVHAMTAESRPDEEDIEPDIEAEVKPKKKNSKVVKF